jgi:hypothetical protein
LERILQWDLSPVKPWEWGELDAWAWTTATAMKNSFEAGMADYRKNKAKKTEQKSSDEARLAKLRKRVGSN